MVTASGNMILTRLIASVVQDECVNGEAIGDMLTSYRYGHPDLCGKIDRVAQNTSTNLLSQRSTELAELAKEFFTNYNAMQYDEIANIVEQAIKIFNYGE